MTTKAAVAALTATTTVASQETMTCSTNSNNDNNNTRTRDINDDTNKKPPTKNPFYWYQVICFCLVIILTVWIVLSSILIFLMFYRRLGDVVSRWILFVYLLIGVYLASTFVTLVIRHRRRLFSNQQNDEQIVQNDCDMNDEWSIERIVRFFLFYLFILGGVFATRNVFAGSTLHNPFMLLQYYLQLLVITVIGIHLFLPIPPEQQHESSQLALVSSSTMQSTSSLSITERNEVNGDTLLEV